MEVLTVADLLVSHWKAGGAWLMVMFWEHVAVILLLQVQLSVKVFVPVVDAAFVIASVGLWFPSLPLSYV